jgi:uncharacterized membrane protein YhaH (DUF805 family)
MSLFHLLFGFSGRANRGKFWLAVVLWIVFWAIAVPACVLAAIIILGLHLPDSSLPHDELIARYVRLAFDYLGLLIVFIAFTIVSWVSAFAVGIKRLHDRDKSGWWILLFYLAPSVLGSIANTSEQAVVSFVLGLASFGISIWGLVELGFLRGTVGPNPYGPDPLQAPAAAHPLRPHPPVPEHLQEDVRSPSAAATSATIRTLVTRFSVGRLQCVLFLR